MPLRGPTFASGLQGSDAIDVRPERPNESGGSDIWVTFGRSGGATRYDLSDLSVKSVLTVPSHLRITTPIVYDPKLGLDVCVVNNNQLLAFDAVSTASNGTKLETLVEDVIDLGRRTKAVDVLLSPTPHQESYVLLEDGQLQTTSFLMNNKYVQSLDGATTPKGSRRFDTRLFHLNERTWASHVYRTDGGSARVKICSVLIEPETCMCKQKPFRELQLEGNVVSATLLDSTVVYVVDDGRVFASELFDGDEKKRKLTLKGGGGGVSLSRASFVSRLDDEGKVAVLGNKEDGEEGQAVIVIDVNVGRRGFVVDGVAVKSVVQSGDDGVRGKRLSCHGGNRIFFKHGHRIAFILVDNFPADLASFVGKRGFLQEEEEEVGHDDEESWQRLRERSQSMQIYDVLPAVLSDRSISGTINILDTFSDIPELCILSMIEMVLEADGNADVLSRLFQVRVTETLMLPHLRRSQFGFAKQMLGRVLDEVKAGAGRGDDDDFDDRFDRLLAWIGLILNAHCCNFLLLGKDDGCARLLEDALETVELVESCVRAMGTTMSLVKLVQDDNALLLLPDRCRDDETYGIEMVDL